MWKWLRAGFQRRSSQGICSYCGMCPCESKSMFRVMEQKDRGSALLFKLLWEFQRHLQVSALQGCSVGCLSEGSLPGGWPNCTFQSFWSPPPKLQCTKRTSSLGKTLQNSWNSWHFWCGDDIMGGHSSAAPPQWVQKLLLLPTSPHQPLKSS